MTTRWLAHVLGRIALGSILLAGCGDGNGTIDPPPEEDWTGCPTADDHVADASWTTTFEEADDLVLCTTPGENNDASPIAEVFRQKLMLRLPAGTYRLPDEEESGPYTLPLCTRTEQGGAAQGIDVTGTINLGGSTLALSGAFVPGSGQSFVLIDNDGADPVARRIREKAVLYIVPNMNPDGASRGNLRSNAAGANLNREWREPTLARSPEVLLVRNAMEASGADLFLDIHGDEALPYVFFSTAEEVPGFSDAQRVRQARFVEAFQAASPDFQTEHGYLSGRFKDELLTLASKWVAHRFGCVSITLEMPFKDNANLPDSLTGWNGKRSKRLGAAMLNPILAHLAN